MSRGPGKIQRAILDVLAGNGRVYDGRILTTAEVLRELEAREAVDAARPRKELMGKTLRALASLQQRGLLTGRYVIDCDNPHLRTVEWEAINNTSSRT